MYDETPQVSGSVVAGIDGSRQSMAAAHWAARWAAAHGQSLTVVAVVPRMPVPTRTGVVRAMRGGVDFAGRVAAAARGHLDDALGELRGDHPSLAIQGALLEGHPVEVLARLSRSAAVTILGATGATGLRGALLGGTVSALLHQAEGPLVVIPAAGGDPDGPVVVGLDGADASPRIAEAAIDAAAALRRRLVAVHAWELEPTAYGAVSLLTSDEDHIDAEVRQMLIDLTASAADSGLEVDPLVRWGRPRDVLAELAPSAALLVVGSRGRGGFPGLLLGSVSRGLTHHPRCPILVVRT